jgi:TetR/AcrR family transcriptional regulator
VKLRRETSPLPANGDGAGSERVPRNAEATKKRILDAGEREFAARGFAGARLREIAVAARVQPALIHHYFADKGGLYEAVLDRGLEIMHSMSWKVLEGSTEMEAIIRGFVDVLVDFYANNESLLAIVRHESLAGASLLLDRARERLGPTLDMSLAIVKGRQDAGEIRDDLSPREIVLAGLSLILYPSIDATFVDALLPPPKGIDVIARRKEVVVSLMLAALAPTGARTQAATAPSSSEAPTSSPSQARRKRAPG